MGYDTVQRHGIYERDLSGSFLLGTTYNHNFLRPRRGEWGYLTTPRLYHVGDVAAVVFAIQRWPLALCTGFAVYQINNTGGRIGCYFTDHPFGNLTSDHTCYNLYNNLSYTLFLNDSKMMWLNWLDTECGQYYVDKLFEALATSFKTQVIIKQAERFFNKGLTKESIKTKLTTELKYGFGG